MVVAETTLLEMHALWRVLILLVVERRVLALVPSSAGLSPRRRHHVAQRRSAVAMTAALGASGSACFDTDTAVLLAGFAFEAYNEPSENDARWERGADGCDVAFMSEAFACECYAGRLEVRLCEAKELVLGQDLAQALLSGGGVDPYVIFALNEESEDGPKEGAIALDRAVDRARSSTRWAKPLVDQWKDRGKEGTAEWDEEQECFYLYVKDPSRAQLALTVFDEEVAKDDLALGAASLKLTSVLKPGGSDEQRRWGGWVPLTWRPAETRENAVQMGAVAGAFVAGPMGAAAGGLIGSLLKKPVQGQVRLELTYTPMAPQRAPPAAAEAAPAALLAAPALEEAQTTEAARTAADAAAAATAAAAAAAGGAGGAGDEDENVAAAAGEFAPVLSNRAAPKGASDGVDWSILSRRVGTVGFNEGDAFELCCFVSHEATSTQAAIWRDCARRRVVLSFRGTSDVIDIVTDVNLLQRALEQRDDGRESDDPRRVHSGFYAGAEAVNRRIKELLVSACEGTPGEWELLVTGHSLGGALATLTAPDLAAGVDTSRGFRQQQQTSWLSRVSSFLQQENTPFAPAPLPALRDVRIYTFGAPRVGNSEFARYFEEVFAGREAFRVVNGEDIVARLPRHANSAGAVLDYEHCGRTVLVDEEAGAASAFGGWWIEGESADAVCPLRDPSPVTNPFSSQNVLGSTSQTLSEAAAKAWGGIDGAAQTKSRAELERAMGDAVAELEKATRAISSRVGEVRSNPLEALTVLGLDKDFVASELKMIDSLRKGTAVTHHLEPSYFAAIRNALDVQGR